MELDGQLISRLVGYGTPYTRSWWELWNIIIKVKLFMCF